MHVLSCDTPAALHMRWVFYRAHVESPDEERCQDIASDAQSGVVRGYHVKYIPLHSILSVMNTAKSKHL